MQKFNTVSEFLESLDADKRDQVEALRAIILQTEPTLKEIIKWNAPNFTLDNEDRITFNVLNKENIVKLVLHMGATRKENKKSKPVLNDTTALVEWNSDIRGMLKFKNLNDIEAKRDKISHIINQWLTIKP